MIREIPLEHVKGQTLDVTGLVTRNGRPRDLVANGDSVSFRICSPDTKDSLLTFDENAGVTLGEDGRFRMIVEPNSLTLDPDEYWYEVWFTEGTSGRPYRLPGGFGPFTLEDSSQ